jgi:hypothetical protein
MIQQKKFTYGRNIGKVTGTQNPALRTVPQLQIALCDQEDIVGLLVVVETGSIRDGGTTLENRHETIGLLRGGQDAEDTLAAGNGDALALELRDGVGHPLGGGLI